jgi:predicted transposase/invertase (TIGR01784 family)
MRTDSFIQRFFREFPGMFFVVIGEDERKAAGYKFKSIEVKEQSFRFDGVFLPKSPDDAIIFVEAQFRKKGDFYTRFMAKAVLYLQHYQPKNPWRAVVIFPRRSIDPGIHHHFQEFFESGRLQRVYLNELPQQYFEKFPLNLFRLILESKRRAIATAEKIVRQLPDHIHDPKEQETIFEMVVNLLMSKLPKLSRKEIMKMFEPYLSDIRKSRAYREFTREGKKEKAREIAKTLLQENMSLAFVVKVTGLSPNEVRAFKKELAARKNSRKN